jgi:hypothetical protein
MSLEEQLGKTTRHTLYYRASNLTSMTLRDFAESFDSLNDVCFVDENVLLNPLDVLKELCASLRHRNKKSPFENIPKLVKDMYGQIRALRTISDSEKLFTTLDSIDNFTNSLDILKEKSDLALFLYKKTSTYDSQCEDLVSTLFDEANQLSIALRGHEYTGNRYLAEDLLKKYTKTDFCQREVYLGNQKKIISGKELLLFAIATYEANTNYQEKNVYLLSNNLSLLAQGPFFLEDHMLNSPEVICAQPADGYGKKFQHHFGRFSQPISQYVVR